MAKKGRRDEDQEVETAEQPEATGGPQEAVGQLDLTLEALGAALANMAGLGEPPTEEEIERAREIFCLATAACRNLVRLADVAAGSNQVGSMGTLSDVVQAIRDLPCVREATGIVKAVAFVGTLIVEVRSESSDT